MSKLPFENVDNRFERATSDTGFLLGGLAEIKSEVIKKFYADEKLLRLLHYLPKSSKNPSPLDPSLPNIIGSKTYSTIIQKCILRQDKSSDVEDTAICRITVSFGKQRPLFNNANAFTQDLDINIFVHEIYNDFRLEQIADRVDQLLLGSRLNGIGKVTSSGKEPFQAMRQYSQLRCRYELIGLGGAF